MKSLTLLCILVISSVCATSPLAQTREINQLGQEIDNNITHQYYVVILNHFFPGPSPRPGDVADSSAPCIYNSYAPIGKNTQQSVRFSYLKDRYIKSNKQQKLQYTNLLYSFRFSQITPIQYLFYSGLFLFLFMAFLLHQVTQKNIKTQRLLFLQKEENTKQGDKIAVILEELKATQRQLLQSDKMASLGQLTAGIAHEINNPINYVYAGIDSLKLNIQDMEALLQKQDALIPGDKREELEAFKATLEYDEVRKDVATLLSSIKNGATRTREIVKGLRTFSHVDEGKFKEFDLHENLESTLLLLHAQTRDRIEIKRCYGEIPRICAYPGPLNQVFMNILANAVQAIQLKGTIVIQTLKTASNTVTIHIRDNGSGMHTSVMKKIFEPFFTTKEVGKGTGLGLSISRGIIQKHHGQIDVKSTIGEGTIFSIVLPIRQKKPVKSLSQLHRNPKVTS